MDNDVILRSSVLNLIKYIDMECMSDYEKLEEGIKGIPVALVHYGHWMRGRQTKFGRDQTRGNCFTCDQCGAHQSYKSPYCPRCGAVMLEEVSHE